MLRRSLSFDDALRPPRPSIHPTVTDEIIAPRIPPSKVYHNHVRDCFYPARQAKMAHSTSYTDLNLAWRSYPSHPTGSFALNYLAEPGWRDRFDHTLKSADRVMDSVHKSLFPTKHHINVGEWAWFDWDSGRVMEPMCRPWWRTYNPPRYSRCWDMKNWTNEYGRTYSHYAHERWRRFAGNRVLGGSWQWPSFWMHRLSENGIFAPYYKNPWYITPMHRYYDYIRDY